MRVITTFMTCLLIVGSSAANGIEIFEGRFVFNKRCARCHDATALMPPIDKLPGDAERRTFLDKFLARHHASDQEERTLIIDYLLRHQPRPAT